MRRSNTAIVQRTQGLFEAQSLMEKLRPTSQNAAMTAQKQRYGSLYRYDEFFVTSSIWKALVLSFTFLLAVLSIRFLPPVSPLVNPWLVSLTMCVKIRWLAKMFLPQPGEGPSDELSDLVMFGRSLTMIRQANETWVSHWNQPYYLCLAPPCPG